MADPVEVHLKGTAGLPRQGLATGSVTGVGTNGLAGGLAGGEDFGLSNGAPDHLAIQPKVTAKSLDTDWSAISLSRQTAADHGAAVVSKKPEPMVNDTTGTVLQHDLPVPQSAVEAKSPGTAQPALPRSAAAVKSSGTAQPAVLHSADTAKKAAPSALASRAPERSQSQTPAPFEPANVGIGADATLLADRQSTVALTRPTRQTGIGETLFRVRALTEVAGSAAASAPVDSPKPVSAPRVAASAVAGQPTAWVDGTGDAVATSVTAALPAEKPLANSHAEPNLRPAPEAAAARPEFGQVAEQNEAGTGLSDPPIRHLPETAGLSPLLPAVRAVDQAKENNGQGAQGPGSWSGGMGMAAPLLPDAGPGPLPRPADIAHQIVRALPGGTGQEVAVVLSPEELGTVRMVMQAKGENLILQIQADRPETLDLMRRSTEQLVQDLRASGFTHVSLDFSQNRRPPTPQPQPVVVAQSYSAGQPSMVLPDTTAPVRRAASGGLDLRL